MCIETSLLLHLGLNSASFYFFVFGATLVQYNLHYLVKKSAVKNSKRLAWSLNNRLVHKVLIVSGSALIIISLFSFHLHHFIFLLILGGIAFFYSFPILPFSEKKRIKDFGLLKIATLALLWTLVTVWFPVDNANFAALTFQLIFLRRFVFIFTLCLLFDIRDIEIDTQEHIATVAVKLGEKKAHLVCYILLVIFVLLSIAQFIWVSDIPQLAAMLLSAAATVMTIEFSKKNNSDFIYLACIDGMILLQAVLVIFASLIKL